MAMPAVRKVANATVNLVPSSTGAAIVAIKALPQLEGKLDEQSIY